MDEPHGLPQSSLSTHWEKWHAPEAHNTRSAGDSPAGLDSKLFWDYPHNDKDDQVQEGEKDEQPDEPGEFTL